MSNIENIKARITNVNNSIHSINSDTDSNVAKKQLLEQQFKDGCEAFKKKYGIEVDASNIVTKRDEALTEQEEQLNSMELVVANIQNGNIEEACRLLGVPMDSVKPQSGTIAKAEVNLNQGAEVSQEQVATTGGTTNVANSGHITNEVLQQESQFTQGGQPIATTTPYKIEKQEVPKIKLGEDGSVIAPVATNATSHPKITVNLEDDEEEKTPEKVRVSMADLGKPTTASPTSSVTNNVNEFMSNIGMGGQGATAPQGAIVNAEVPNDFKASTGSAVGKGLNDVLNGNI